MATHSEFRCMHLCTGYGGFELGLRLAGVRSRSVCHVERDSFAAATLVARMAEENLDQAPIWDDLTTFDGQPWRNRVDLISAGFPCQPFSLAGSQLGVNDHRWLWPAIKRIICDVGPSFVFLENVPQLVRGGLPFVLADLAELGFNAEWGLYSAAEVGAPHKRERFWLLAYATSFDEREPNHEERAEPWCDTRGDTGWNGEQLGDTTSSEPAKVFSTWDSRSDPERASGRSAIRPAMGDTSSERRPKNTGSTHSHEATIAKSNANSGGDFAHSTSQTVADTSGSRSKRFSSIPITDAQKFSDASSGGSATWPPGKDGDWAEYIAKGGAQPSVRRGTDGPTQGLADTLHLGGNGLVPAVAAAAFIELYRRLMSGD